MQSTLPPRFVDTFQAASSGGANNPNAWASTASMPFAESSDQGRSMVLSQRYKYWKYIAIHRTAERMAQAFPVIGVPAASRGESVMTQADRQWVVQSYGFQSLAHPDTDFMPLADTHPFVRLLKDVNPRQTWQEFIADTVIQWELTGRFYWWAVPNGLGLPVQLWVIPTAWVSRVFDRDGTLLKYQVTPTRSRWLMRDIPVEEIVCGEYTSPEDPNEAWSGSAAAPLWTEATLNIEQSRALQFKQGMNPDLIMHVDREVYGNPGDEVLNRIKERFVQRAAGMSRRGEPVLIPGGIKAEKWSQSPAEMDYPESAAQVRDNELALEGTPAIVAGISHDYNRATADTAFEVWGDVILNPKFRRLAGVLQEKLAWQFDPRILVYFPDCKPKSAEQVLKEITVGFDRGAVTPNEVRQSMGLPRLELPEMDMTYIPANMTPLVAPDEPDDEPVDEPPEEPDDGNDNEDDTDAADE